MPIWVLAKKELWLMLRDVRAALILIAMPLVFILVLGLLLGESFGQKPDDRIRIMIVDLDQGPGLVPGQPWSAVVRDDLKTTAGIRVEVLPSREEAEQLVRDHKQAAVLIFEPAFGQMVSRCSFLADGVNPFHHDGVYLEKVGATLLKDEARQPGQAAIIEQVAQVSLLRVLLPYMIGKAFERLSEPEFIELLGNKVELPVPGGFPPFLVEQMVPDKTRYRFSPHKVQFSFLLANAPLGPFSVAPVSLFKPEEPRLSLNDLLVMAASKNDEKVQQFKHKVGSGVQASLREQFAKYDLTGMTWEKLTKSTDRRAVEGEETAYLSKEGTGILHRGAYRYQLLVPSYTVMFAFFLVMSVGWLFVAERRQGTLKRLRAAPLTRVHILLGKLIPCFLLAFGQGVLLLIAGRLVFGMRWGPDQWSLGQQLLWLLPVVAATSLAATGLAMLVACLARTEIQVALYGAVPVLVLALIGGCVLPREMMPEQTQWLTLFTPQGWALEAYRELLSPDANYLPNLTIVAQSCAALAAFGVGFTALAWWLLRLD
jgi:ABC-2 type transport system permease protein